MQASIATSAGAATGVSDTTGDLVYGLMRAIMFTPEEDRFKAIEDNDLTVSQVRALVTLACADPEPVSGGRIAERIGASPAAVSRALDGLVQKGFVTRRESTADRRVRLFAMTARGLELADDLVALRRAQIDRFLNTLTAAERDRIRDALAPLAAAERIAAGAKTGAKTEEETS